MRILLITKELPQGPRDAIVSGAVKNPYHLAMELVARGHELRILSFDRGAPPAAGGSCAGMPANRFRTAFLKLFPKTLWLNLKSTRAVYSAAGWCDLIQGHHPHFCLQAALLKRLGLIRVPLLVKAHGTAHPELHANRYRGLKGLLLRLNAWIHLRIDRFVFDSADRTVSSSAFQVAEMVGTYRVDRSRIALVYNGYPSAPYSEPQAESFGGGATLLFVGRVVPKKGIDHFIAIVRALSARIQVRGVLVLGKRGEIEDPSLYREIIAPLAEDPRFIVRFDVPEPQLPSIYAGCAALLVPSRGYESVPTVIYEAHAAGTPVFATFEWGIREVVREGFRLTGELDRDVDAVHRFLAAPPRAAGALPPSQAYDSGEFTWSSIAARFESIYRELGAGHGR